MDENGPKEQFDYDEQRFEQALTRALRPIDAPVDFTARVMARAEAERRTAAVGASTAASTPRQAGLWQTVLSLGWKPAWGGLAAMLVGGVLMGHVVHERHIAEQERVRVEASHQFDVSVQITDKALDHAREQLRRAGVPLDGDEQ